MKPPDQIALAREREGEAYGEGYRAGLADAGQAQAEAQEAAALARLEDPPADPIAELLAHLADRASAIRLGDTFRDGPLAGASRYNVALAAIREIVTWDHFRKGPTGDECSACGQLRACSPQGATGYPQCLPCYERAVLDLAGDPPPLPPAKAGRPIR